MIVIVGFYQYIGDWFYILGIFVKIGVGGGVMGVMLGVMGIVVFVFFLDDVGNFVKVQFVIKYIMNKLGMNVFNGYCIYV